jgi:diguanylate cyclase (GGDEF)-like protein/PAS domain S-box-containing protein
VNDSADAAPPLDAWSALIDTLLEPVYLVDAATRCILVANESAATLLGTEADRLRGQSVMDLSATVEDIIFWNEATQGLTDAILSDTLVRRLDGALVPVTRRVGRMKATADAGEPNLYVVTLQDRRAQRATEEELQTRLAELHATLESTADGILVTDLGGAIRNFNHRFATLWGIPDDLLKQRDDAAIHAWMAQSVVDGELYARRLRAIENTASVQTSDVFALHSGRMLERISMPQRSHGQPIGRVFSFRDISDKLAATQRIERLSKTDVLTGLPNREVLADRINLALDAAQHTGEPFALMALNLDRFRHINDNLGLRFGDRVLREVTQRLQSCIRNVDTVARLGGDEFVLLVHQADEQAAEATARRVMDVMAAPFVLDTLHFTVTCSMGVVLCPQDGHTMDVLMRRANAAMGRVKEAGRANYRFHQAHQDADQRSHMQIDHAMRQALAGGHFRLHYQPQLDLRSGQVIGAEALIRWRDATLGEVSPAEFIPLAEESGFIVPIGEWVLTQAVQQAAAWRTNGLAMPVSVNVSALQFQQPDFVARVADTLKAYNLPAPLLELELTESILIHDAPDALKRLHALRALGVRMSIDDFGTGYSSLAYLKRLPIERLKIDQSFIKNLPDDRSDLAIVNAIIQFGHAMQLKVIAEGVETEAQRASLVDAGCDEFQGFLYAPAMDNKHFVASLAPADGTATSEPAFIGGTASDASGH